LRENEWRSRKHKKFIQSFAEKFLTKFGDCAKISACMGLICSDGIFVRFFSWKKLPEIRKIQGFTGVVSDKIEYFL